MIVLNLGVLLVLGSKVKKEANHKIFRLSWTIWVSLPKSEQAKVDQAKRGAVHGVGAGKFRGHYYPINIGPRAAELKRNLLLTAEAKMKKEERQKERVRWP